MTTQTVARSPEERAAWYVDRGVRALNGGDIRQARELFTRAIVTDVLSPAAYEQLMRSSSQSRTAHRFSVVVATWNRLGDLQRCLDGLRRNSFYANEIIVVDNVSSDGTIEFLREQSDVRVILNTTEVSVSRATNQGWAIATGDFVGLLNDDTEVMPGWDLAIVETLDTDRRAGAAVPLVVYPDGRVQAPGQYNPFFSLTHPWIGNVPHMDTSAVVGSVLGNHAAFHVPRACDYGMFPFLTRACFDRIGGFDEQFGHYFADPDLGYRVQQAGFKNLYCPTSVVVHHELSRHQVERRNTRFEETASKFASKWSIVVKSGDEPPRRSFQYIDEYLHRCGAGDGGDEPAPAAEALQSLAAWIPATSHDVLDIGPGSRDVVRYLRTACGRNAIGLTDRGDFSFLPLGNTSCDFAMVRQWLARSPWPLIALFELNRVLDAGGDLLVTVPPCEDRWVQDPRYRHVLNEAQWRRLFAEAGFTVVRAEAPDAHIAEDRYLLRKDRAIVDTPRIDPALPS